jgi:hypothetical protein
MSQFPEIEAAIIEAMKELDVIDTARFGEAVSRNVTPVIESLVGAAEEAGYSAGYGDGEEGYAWDPRNGKGALAATLTLRAAEQGKRLRGLIEKWQVEFSRLSNSDFGGRGEMIGNVMRVCAEELAGALGEEGTR